MALRVARHKSKSFPTGKAVFYLEGGPGGSAVEYSRFIYKFFSKLRDKHDLIYVDQRGTGGSDYLGCPGGCPSTSSGWVECASAFPDKDLNRYLSIDAAHDLEAVRHQLGYEKIYLYGISYGTRLGFEFLRQHESSVAAAVLDGVLTPDNDYFGDMLKDIDKGLTHLVEDCNKSTECKSLVPDLASDLLQRREALKKNPRTIYINGSPYSETESLYINALESLLASARWYFRIPRACSSWKVTPLSAELRQEVKSKAKTLLMSGDLDFITFSEWTELAVKNLSNGNHLLIPYTVHGTLANSCAAKIIEDFIIADGSFQDVDTSCIQKLTSPAW